MDILNVKIQSERLLLIPVSEKFADDIFHEFDAEITKYMCPAPPTAIDDTLSYIKDAHLKMKDGTNFHCVVISIDSNEFIGCAGVHKVDTNKPELGIWVKKSAHNKGYGKEIIFSLMQWAKGVCDQIEYFIYPVDKRNLPSRRIPEYFGATKGNSYKQKNESGNILDIIVYHIPN